MLVIGKTIGGGIPVAAYGMTAEVAERIRDAVPIEDSDVGGIGGTLAGYALSMAAARAALGEVLTEAAFARMIPLAERWERGANEVIAAARGALERDPPRGPCRVPLHARAAAGRRGPDRAQPTTSWSGCSTCGS